MLICYEATIKLIECIGKVLGLSHGRLSLVYTRIENIIHFVMLRDLHTNS